MPRVEYKRQFSIEFLFGTILERGASGIENASDRAKNALRMEGTLLRGIKIRRRGGMENAGFEGTRRRVHAYLDT